MRSKILRWFLFFWKMYFFFFDLSFYEENKEMIFKYVLDFYCVLVFRYSIRLEFEGWIFKLDREGFARDVRVEF